MSRPSRAGPIRRRVVPPIARPILVLLAVATCAALPGCLTCAMWDKLDHSRGERIAAVALTPVTVAVDVTFVAGYVAAESYSNGGGGCCRWHCCH